MRLLLAYLGILTALSLLFGVFRLDIYLIQEYFPPRSLLFLELQFIYMLQITILLLSTRYIRLLNTLKKPLLSFVIGFVFSVAYFPLSLSNFSKIPVLDTDWMLFIIFPIIVFSLIVMFIILVSYSLRRIKQK